MGITAGILLVIISIAHIIYGEKKQIPALKAITNDSVMIGSQRIMVSQGGIILLAVGIVQIMIYTDMLVLTGVAIYFPVGIILINVVTSLLIILIGHQKILKITLPQFVIFGAIITLQLLALR